MSRRRSGRSVGLRKQGGWIWQAIGAGISLFSGLQGKKAADDAGKVGKDAEAAQTRALDTQSDLALVNNARGQEMYDEYMDFALPANLEALALARKKINPNVEAAAAGADVAQQEAVAAGTRKRRAQAVGVDPSSGAAQEGERLSLLDSTLARSGAMTGARRNATDRQIERIGSTSQLLNPLIGAGATYSRSANAGLSDVASSFGSRADAAGAIAGAGAAEWGATLADVAARFENWKPPAANTSVVKPPASDANYPGPR